MHGSQPARCRSCSAMTGFLVVLLAATSLGCGRAKDAKRAKTFPAAGVVTMNGAPVVDAQVTFSPPSGSDTPAAFAHTDDRGQFTLTTYSPGDGAAPGNYTVLIAKFLTAAAPAAVANNDLDGGSYQPPEEMSDSRPPAKPKSFVPEKYSQAGTSDLKATITEAGPNEFKFELLAR